MTDPGAPAARPAIWRQLDELIARKQAQCRNWFPNLAGYIGLYELIAEAELLEALRAGADDRAPAQQEKAEEEHTDPRGGTMEIPEGRRTASQSEMVRALTDRARRAVDGLRDFAREHGMTHFRRDPLVMDIHRALDAFDEAAALDAAPSSKLKNENSEILSLDSAKESQPCRHDAGIERIYETTLKALFAFLGPQIATRVEAEAEITRLRAGAAGTVQPSAPVVRKLEMLSEHMCCSPVSVVPAYGESLGDLVRELQQQLAVSPSALAWQPIETATKDGRVLVFWNARQNVAFTGFWGRTVGTLTESWLSAGEIAQPTHWRPLPSAPRAQPEADAAVFPRDERPTSDGPRDGSSSSSSNSSTRAAAVARSAPPTDEEDTKGP